MVVQQVLPPVTHDVLGQIHVDNFRAVFFSVGTDVLDERPRQVTIWRSDDLQRDMNVVANPVEFQLHGRGLIGRNVHSLEAVVPGGDGEVQRLEHGLLHLPDQHDGVFTGLVEFDVSVHGDFGRDVSVITVHTDHQEVEHGHG